MRFTAIIFALYMLMLACYPCMDRDACADELSSGSAQVTLADHHQNSNEQDHCSPLCICSCCTTFIQLSAAVIVVPAHVSHNTQLVVPYQQRALLTGTHSIWQPPRLA